MLPFRLYAKDLSHPKGQGLFFIENKNQIIDQNGKQRSDIQFSVKGNGISVFIGNGQTHYQFYKKDFHDIPASPPSNKNCLFSTASNTETYRMDVELLGADVHAKAVAEQEDYYEYYFLPGCPSEGIKAQTFKQIKYVNIYPSIDWVMRIAGGKVEQEFVVRPGGDVSLIKLKYYGQTGLAINNDGSITATTPMGTIKESAPVCYFVDGGSSPVSYSLDGNTLSYKANGNGHALVLDPTLEWGTYYGPDSNNSPLNSLACDDSANIYAGGFTYATIGNIATTGSYQDSCGGEGDAYLVKFDSSGNRLWATFYGGTKIDWGNAVACDHSGHVYLAGFTASTDSNAIATPGSHQEASGGGWNGFLAKFTSSGSRVWATYYGGNETDIIYSVNCDYNGHVYIAGVATSENNIASPGSFETAFANPFVQFTAGFLAQFDTSGVRNWGTYYEAYDSSSLSDVLTVLSCTDGVNVYISGYTSGTDSIATAGSWQPVYGGGGGDAFIAKFDALGNRVWATYCGGENQEKTGSIVCDGYGNIFLLGATNSDSAIASAGCAQPLRAGGYDAFIAKFEPVAGTRLWGTYYGGPADETVDWSQIATDRLNSVYITGLTASLSGIVSAGAWQPTYGGGDHDGFFAKYDGSGAQLWATYYGGTGDDQSFACAFDGLNAYICGKTDSPDSIATSGSFDSTCDGDSSYNKGFLAKFSDMDTAYIALKTKNIQTRNIRLYPIPSSDFFYITGLKTNDILQLYNETGQKIDDITIANGSDYALPVNALPSGLYILVIYDRNGNPEIRKLVEKI